MTVAVLTHLDAQASKNELELKGPKTDMDPEPWDAQGRPSRGQGPEATGTRRPGGRPSAPRGECTVTGVSRTEHTCCHMKGYSGRASKATPV